MTIIDLEKTRLLKEYKKELSLFNKVCDLVEQPIFNAFNQHLEIKEIELKEHQSHCLKCKSIVSSSLFCGKCFTWWEGIELSEFKSYDEYLKDNLTRAKK